MVLGFVGALIALERAVALRRAVAFASPALHGLGWVLLLTALPIRLGQTHLVAGAATLVVVYLPLWRSWVPQAPRWTPTETRPNGPMSSFNGYADQYVPRPLTARVGDGVPIWALDAGPNRSTTFYVVGGQFDTVYAEGAYLLRPGGAGGSQALALEAAQGGFVELMFREAGHYLVVSHVTVDAEPGARGIMAVARRPEVTSR